MRRCSDTLNCIKKVKASGPALLGKSISVRTDIPDIYFSIVFYLRRNTDISTQFWSSVLPCLEGLIDLKDATVDFGGRSRRTRAAGSTSVINRFSDAGVRNRVGSCYVFYPEVPSDKLESDVVFSLSLWPEETGGAVGPGFACLNIRYDKFLDLHSAAFILKIRELMDAIWRLENGLMSYAFASFGYYGDPAPLTLAGDGVKKARLFWPSLFEWWSGATIPRSVPRRLHGLPLPNISDNVHRNLTGTISDGKGVKGVFWGNFLSKQYVDRLEANWLEEIANVASSVEIMPDGGASIFMAEDPFSQNSEHTEKARITLGPALLREESEPWIEPYLE